MADDPLAEAPSMPHGRLGKRRSLILMAFLWIETTADDSAISSQLTGLWKTICSPI